MEWAKGQRVVITGASRGIGYLLTLEFLRAGAHVIGVARSKEKLLEIENEYERFKGVSCDLSLLSCSEEVFRKTMNLLNGVDILVNNAGFAEYGSIADQEWDSIYSQIMVNMVAPIYLTKLFLNQMIEQDKGKIVFVLTGGVFAYMSKMGVYGASKAGLNYFAEVLLRELKKTNIDVILVYPGRIVDTGFFDRESFRRARMRKCMPFECTTAREVVDAIIRAIKKKGSRKVYVPKALAILAKIGPRIGISI